MSEKLRVPCLQDPVGTACDPDCPNFTYSLQLLRRLAKRDGISPEEFAERFPQEADRLANKLAASDSLPKRLFRRCKKQPNKIRFVK